MLLAFTATTATTFQSCGSAGSALSSSTVGSIGSSLLSILGSQLGLNPSQSSIISGLLSTFLNNKVKLGVASTGQQQGIAAVQQQQKLTGLQNSLTDGLKGALTPAQMQAFAALKPATNDPKNVLSHLFF